MAEQALDGLAMLEAKKIGAKAGRSYAQVREAAIIDWRSHDLTPAHFKMIGTLGTMLPNLKVLYLSHNNVGDEGIGLMAMNMADGAFPVLVSLGLSDCRVGDRGAQSLANAFSQGALPRVEELWLDNNQITDFGIFILAPICKRMPCLKVLSLAFNRIGDRGTSELGSALPGGLEIPFKMLQQLDLSFNNVTGVGCSNLAAAIRGGFLPSLVEIDLGNVGPKGLLSIQMALNGRIAFSLQHAADTRVVPL